MVFIFQLRLKIEKGYCLHFHVRPCHGTHGLSPGAMSTLYGKSLEYIEQTMQGYKSDNRPSTMMHRIAKGYTLEEIRLISKYFSSLYTGKSLQ